VRDPSDLLIQLALEHRDLTHATRALRRRTGDRSVEAVRRIAIPIVEHEVAHRLLVHPLLARDERGRSLLRERREEQRLLAGRLRQLLSAEPRGPNSSGRRPPRDAATALDDDLVEHTDREEIVAFPHVRHLATAEELHEIGSLRPTVREAVSALLDEDDAPIRDGRWAELPRDELLPLFDLRENLVIEVPDLIIDVADAEVPRSAASN
jgi:hypothetical protein